MKIRHGWAYGEQRDISYFIDVILKKMKHKYSWKNHSMSYLSLPCCVVVIISLWLSYFGEILYCAEPQLIQWKDDERQEAMCRTFFFSQEACWWRLRPAMIVIVVCPLQTDFCDLWEVARCIIIQFLYESVSCCQLSYL